MNYWSVKALLSRVYLYMNDNENALKCAEEVINDNGGIYRLFTHDEYPSVWGKDFNSESLFEFYFTMSEPSGGSGGEGAPMVYADNVKDWNNLIQLWKFFNLHIIQVIKSVDQTKLDSYWCDFEGTRVTLQDMIEGYLSHLHLHIHEIHELMNA